MKERRVLAADEISACVARLCMEANTHLPVRSARAVWGREEVPA